MTPLEIAVRKLLDTIDTQEVDSAGIFPITSRFHGLYKGPQNPALKEVRECLEKLENMRIRDAASLSTAEWRNWRTLERQANAEEQNENT